MSLAGVTSVGSGNGQIPSHAHTGTSSSAGAAHTHPITDSTLQASGPAANLPAYREVVVCAANATAEVPVGARILVQGECVGPWTADASFDDRLLRGHDGDDDQAETGGSDTHDHTIAHDHGGATGLSPSHTHGVNLNSLVVTNGATRNVNGSAPLSAIAEYEHAHSAQLTASQHLHNIDAPTASSASGGDAPSWRAAEVCGASSDGARVGEGMFVLFEVDCPAGWRVPPTVSWTGRFIRGRGAETNAPATGGSDTHAHDATHDHLTSENGHGHVVSGVTTSTYTAAAVANYGSGVSSTTGESHAHALSAVGSADSHGHSLGSTTASLGNVEALPEYREFVLCELEP